MKMLNLSSKTNIDKDVQCTNTGRAYLVQSLGMSLTKAYPEVLDADSR
ncbi:hypothetical protein [Sphingobacterium paludis]|uniref:Uncharacterized protein n=1 Tax=Sphingobacterium paludis TaxID=1476465 RepID=A0A4R7D8Z4_9SPHI|nr:hypothetical protein [Sphingobacterium paludis]TDS17753.1 hypothetical protein B0I21_101626 [Sphingobacterium paludis]